MSEQRERFEAWALAGHMNIRKSSVGDYYSDEKTEASWRAWIAACPQGFKPVPLKPTEDMINPIDRLIMMGAWEYMLSKAPDPDEIWRIYD